MFPVQISEGEVVVDCREAWDMTWASLEESLSDRRFYVAAVVGIGGLLAFQVLVYRLPELLIPYVVGLILLVIFIALDVLRDRELSRRWEGGGRNKTTHV